VLFFATATALILALAAAFLLALAPALFLASTLLISASSNLVAADFHVAVAADFLVLGVPLAVEQLLLPVVELDAEVDHVVVLFERVVAGLLGVLGLDGLLVPALASPTWSKGTKKLF
jgi:hypothetical protein